MFTREEEKPNPLRSTPHEVQCGLAGQMYFSESKSKRTICYNHEEHLNNKKKIIICFD
jgi:hypothetical protein